jgi:pimeloyl-ACP methyl ester carboxylesterase
MATLSCKIDSVVCDDGEQLYGIAQGNLENPTETVIFVPGLGGGFTSTTFVIEELLRLNPHLRCITYDPRGQGRSSHHFQKKEKLLIHALANDLARVAKFYEVAAPIIVGHSLGGLVVQEYVCAEFMPTPKKCILISSPLSPKLFPQSLGSAAYQLLHICNNLLPAVPHVMSIETHLRYKNSFDFSIFRIYHDITTMGVLPFFFFWGNVSSWKTAYLERFISRKPLLIFGERDLIIPRRAQEKIKKFFAQSPVKTLPTNHNPVINEPELLAQAINEYISS